MLTGCRHVLKDQDAGTLELQMTSGCYCFYFRVRVIGRHLVLLVKK